MPVFDAHSYLGGNLIPGVAHNAAAITAAMKARGVDRAMLLSSHARNIDPIAGNRILKVMVEQAPELYGCLITHVNRVEASTAIMRELMPSRKFIAMAIAGARADEPVHKIVADEIINAYRRYGKPLCLFTPNGEAAEAALEIAKAYPMLRVILLGMGGIDWRTAIAAAQQSTNIFLESSGALDRAKLPAALEALAAHRIVFGSGSPRTDAAAALGLLEDSEMPADARRRILSDNAARLFGFGHEEGGEPAA